MPGAIESITGNVLGESPTTTTPFQSLPGFGQQGYQDAIARAMQLFNSPGAFRATPRNQAQIGALDGLVKQGQQAGPQALGYQQGATDAYGASRNMLGKIGGQVNLGNQYLNDASGYIQQGVNPITGEQLQSGIADFMNPYTQQVIDTTARDLTEQGQGQLGNIASLAGSRGAFGGSRQAILEAESLRNTQRNIGDVTGGLRNQAFTTASNQALQRLTDERNRFLEGAGLATNQAGQAYSGAGALAQGGNALANLGNSYTDARTANIAGRGAQIDQRVQNLKNQLEAGDIRQQTAIQNQQIPLKQLEVLLNALSGIPRASSTTATENPGTLGRLSSIFGIGS